MGHSKIEKAASHERIVTVAARQFAERGFDGAALAELMAEAGLTHGGFYKHFASRDQLLMEATARAFENSKAHLALRMSEATNQDLSAFLNAYLTSSHRDDMANGCPVASLTIDASRAPAANQVFQDRFRAYAEWVGKMLSGPEQTKTVRGAAVICAAAGGIAVARALGKGELSSAVLDATYRLILAAEMVHRKRSSRKVKRRR
jgi:TetR/AcrR family transcriptional repressor of nem operon